MEQRINATHFIHQCSYKTGLTIEEKNVFQLVKPMPIELLYNYIIYTEKLPYIHVTAVFKIKYKQS